MNGGALLPPRITISDQPGDQFDPHVDGDLAVYSTSLETGSTFVETIEYYRFSTDIRSTVPTQPSYVDLLSEVDRGRIVFTRFRPSAGPYAYLAIMLFDTATGVLQETSGAARLIALQPRTGRANRGLR